MSNLNPTVVIAQLDDDKLRASIDSLVTHFNSQLEKMKKDSTSAVQEITQTLNKLGEIKVDMGGSANGGSSRRAKAQTEEAKAVKDTAMAYDQLAKVQQVAVRSGDSSSIRNADVLQTMNVQLDLLRERLREARQQYSSFVALAAHATTTGDKGLFQFATEGVHRYEQEVHNLIPQIRNLQTGIKQMGDVIAPQGHTMQNYVNSLQKTNPQLALLNEQFKSGKSLLQQQTTSYEAATSSAQKYTDEIRRQADAIRKNEEFRKTGIFSYDVGNKTFAIYNDSKFSIEEQLLRNQKELARLQDVQRENEEKIKIETQGTVSVAQQQLNIERQITEEQIKRKQYKTPSIGTPFEKMVANTLNIGVSDVKTSSQEIQRLNVYLNQLQQTWNRLTPTMQNSNFGRMLKEEFQTTSRYVQQLRKDLSTPINLDAALKGPEKTLDDIAYKIQRLQSYKRGINLTDPKQVAEIKTIDAEINRLNTDLNKYMGTTKKASELNNALTRSWNYMKNRLAFYFTVGASTQFVRNLIEVRSQYEMNEKALGILLDSASRGTRIFNELSQMSLVSPYTLIELSNAAKQLTAYDIAAKDVVDTTRRLADMASAVGVPVERLTYALGQIKAYGYLNSRDARMFANAGIPLVKQLADYYSELEGKMVSTADVYDRMKKKAIDYADVMKVVNKMTDEGGKFYDFQAKMADTLKVRLANLTLAWNNMLNDIGKDSQGVTTTGLKGLTVLFKHWRELSRIISTVIVAIGTYKTASMVAGISASRAVSSTIPAWLRLANTVRTTQGNIALLGLTMRSIPFTTWVTAIATIASYFVLFNQTSEETKQKLGEITNAYSGVRKEVEDLYANAISTDNLGTQLTKLRDMLELAQTELGVTIPINLEDVNESNVKQKLKETKQLIEDYVNFSQLFSEKAIGTDLNERMNEFGSEARNTYTRITESINAVKVGLEELASTGKASARDIEILKELDAKPKDGESRIEYLQRMVSLYEELGLIGKKESVVPVGGTQSIDNFILLQKDQEAALNRLSIKNKEVFASMLTDVQDYYYTSGVAAKKFEQQVMRVAKEVDINNIPVEQRTIKLNAAINEEASLHNWNQFEKEFARQILNRKFGTTIEISEESKQSAEEDLQAWQKRQKDWFNNNKIDVKLDFQTNDTELSYAKRTLQDYKDKLEEVEVQRRKLNVGTGLKEDLDKAIEAAKKAQIVAKEAGADLESLNKKTKEKTSKKDVLGEAISKEVQYINDIQKRFKEYKQAGVDAQEALTLATNEYGKSIVRNNAILQKYGIKTLSSSQLASMPIQKIRDFYKEQLSGASASTNGVEALEKAIANLNTEITKIDYKRITDGLNNELSKIKDEYELAVELDANPELGNIFTDIFDIDPNELPQNLDEYAARVTDALNKSFEKQKKNFRLPTIELTDDDLKAYKAESEKPKGLITEADYKEIEKQTKEIRNLRKKDREDTLKRTQELQYKLGDINEKIAIETKKLTNLQIQAEKEKNAEKKALLELEIQDQEQAISKLKEQILSELPAYKALFESITDYSNGVVNRLAKNYKRVLDEAKKRGLNNNGKYTLTEGDVTVELTPERLNKEYKNVFKEIRKSESAFAKIKNAFTGDKGTNTQKDWAKGLELIAEEARKAADGVRTVAEIFDALGGDEDTTEILNDVATSMEGIATAGQGVSQIASGDYIGGTVNVIKGAWQAISTWFDNDNKKIDRQIEKSKFKVQELELAYKKLEYAAKKALGTEETVAKRESIAVKEQELAELERQLALEQQKDYKKNSDKREQKERIQDYLDSIESLKQEIQDAKEEIVNNLLGSDVKSAAEEFVDTWVEAWRAGETTLDAIQDKMDEVIFNLIKKSMTSKIVETLLNPFYKEVDRMTSAESEMGDALTINELRQLAQMAGVTAEQINTALGEFYGNLDALDIISQSSEANKQLSALQQGIQGITEDTAGALEAYMNGVSQQVYLHSQLLTEIRNAVVSMDNDIQMGIQAQMLLQLQQSYAVQMAIQNILLGWSNPSGMAVKVEMI